MSKPANIPTRECVEDVFREAWTNAVKLDQLEDEFSHEHDETRRKEIQRDIRSLANKITPTAKRVAADRNRPMISAMNEFLQKNGAPTNIADVLDWLRSQGFVIGEDNEPKPADGVTARTARLILHKIFAIDGEKGRKPKKR
jgi:hypothetical protein